jgi:ABC-2 type transport system ATP-binding protein
VLFLDEPTTGLDPRSRVGMWDTILRLARTGSTVLLTTQYMEEADRLADEIVVIDRGRMIAHGTPDQLKTKIGGERVEVVVESGSDLTAAQSALAGLSADGVQVDEQTRRLTAPVEGGADALQQILRKLKSSGVTVLEAGLRRPTLDDVFLILTGHVAEEGSGPEGDGAAADSSRARLEEAV